MILVRKETNPDDLRGMVAARGILTSRGGKTSHAAVVARGMGRTCVCGAESLDVDTKAKEFRVRDGETIREGDVISIDGTHRRGLRRRRAGRPTRSWCATSRARSSTTTWPTRSRASWPTPTARAACACAPTPTPPRTPPAPAASAPRASACAAPSTCSSASAASWSRSSSSPRTEAGVEAALAALLPLQRQDFTEILEAMDGLPVTIRLLDPPLHEFLPDLTELSVEVALAEERGQVDERAATLLDARPPAPRAEPDARPARRPARHPDPRPVPHAGQGDRGGGRRPDGRPRHAAAGDHGAAGRQRPRAGDRPRRASTGSSRRSRRSAASSSTSRSAR